MDNVCPIWGTASDLEQVSDAVIVDSTRCGGRYRVTGTALPMLEKLPRDNKVLLTDWLIEQRISGKEVPVITSSVIHDLEGSRPKTILERRDNLLEAIAKRSNHLGQKLFVESSSEAVQNVQFLCAFSSSKQNTEVIELLTYMHEDGLIEFSDWKSVKISFKGWRFLEERNSTNRDSSQAFVAMWFSDDMETFYREGVEPAIADCKYSSRRIDKKDHNNKIDDEIIAEIRKSRFLVADFTSETDKPRGGVYFEAGFAMGLGIPVIWMCHSKLIGQVHFDTRQYNHILWTNPAEARERLHNRILATIGEGHRGS